MLLSILLLYALCHLSYKYSPFELTIKSNAILYLKIVTRIQKIVFSNIFNYTNFFFSNFEKAVEIFFSGLSYVLESLKG